MFHSKNFYEKEEACRIHFSKASPCWHLTTPEDFPILFTCEKDYQSIMAIIGISSLMHPDLKIYTFQVMSNHIHFVIGGDEDRVCDMFDDIKRMLSAYLKSEGKYIDLNKWSRKQSRIDTLEYFRAAVAYCHRNAYVIYPKYTPVNYPWGANRFFFCKELKELHRTYMKDMQVRSKRDIIKSHRADTIKGPGVVNNCASPVSFCHIDEAEMMFRDARNYFSVLTKEIESQKDIAKLIGETIFCTDEEIFKIALAKCNKEFNKGKIVELTYEEKVNLALMMHRDYNASNKQICRILRMDILVVNNLFPFKAKEG